LASLKDSWAYRQRLPLTATSIVAGIILVVLSRPTINEDDPLDFWLDLAASAMLGLGVIIRLWATRSIAGRKRQEVVGEGAYSVCRNPLYWGTLFIAIAAALFLKSWTFAVICLGPVALYPLGVVPAEERYLREKLGEPYLEYCRRVPRWWPRFRNYTPLPASPASALAARAELVRSVWWVLMIPLASAGLCWLRSLPTIPKIWPLS
jgi:protein-S-isoprenylcysteine O-methyltransferase Ste14